MPVKIVTMKVDFAGTREEAREFVQAHRSDGLHLGNAEPDTGNEGLPQITARCTSYAAQRAFLDLFKSLGWDEEFVGRSEHVYAC